MSAIISEVAINDKYKPGFGISVFTALLPVILMLLSTIVQMITGHQDGATNQFESIVYFIGNAPVAMLISYYSQYILWVCQKNNEASNGQCFF